MKKHVAEVFLTLLVGAMAVGLMSRAEKCLSTTPRAGRTSLVSSCTRSPGVAPATPLFVIRRERDTAIRLGLFQANADDYIREPFDSIELIARIRSAVRRSKK